MKPLQLFLPFLGGGLGTPEAARDMARAVRAWDGEHRIWLLPGSERPVLWSETWHGNQAFLHAIPAEQLNAVDVYHVGENGYAYGPPEFDRFSPDWRVDGLLDAWLNWVKGPTIRWQMPAKIGLDVPVFVGEGVGYEPVELDSHVGPSFPCVKGREGEVIFRRPDRSTDPISPEAELAEYYSEIFGKLRRSEVDGAEVWLSDRDPNFRSLGVALWADAPLTGYFPTGVNLDALHHWVKMYGVIQQSTKDPRRALKRALDWLSDYVGEGRSDLAHSWLMPTIAEVRDITTVIQRAETYGLSDASTWAEVARSKEWKERMTAPIPIRRAWGPIGLFWSLILERLENAQPIQFCERCGRSIGGTRRKKFCARNDDLQCFLRRRAADRQRERTK